MGWLTGLAFVLIKYPNIAVSEVIAEDEKNVGTWTCYGRGCEHGDEQKQKAHVHTYERMAGSFRVICALCGGVEAAEFYHKGHEAWLVLFFLAAKRNKNSKRWEAGK